MKNQPEDLLLFYSALSDRTDYVDIMTDKILDGAVDWEYLCDSSEYFGIMAGLYNLVQSREGVPAYPLRRLAAGTVREEYETETMLVMYRRVASVLSDNGHEFIPLKGCDPRIADGARKHCNHMIDIDILIRFDDTDEVCALLEQHGFLYQGTLGDSHMNFFSDEARPRFVEIHWDLVNRNNPLHRRLFEADIEKIWARSLVKDGVRLLSYEDTVCYLTAHAVKEYFRAPKWLADISWFLDHRPGTCDNVTMRPVIAEWGVDRSLGFIAEGLDALLQSDYSRKALACGAAAPNFSGRYVAGKLICYDRLRGLRPMIFMAAAGTPLRIAGTVFGAFQRVAQKFMNL